MNRRYIDDIATFVRARAILPDTRRQNHAGDRRTGDPAKLLTQGERIILSLVQHGGDIVEITPGTFSQLRKPPDGVRARAFATFAAAHAITHDIHAVAGIQVVLIGFPAQTDIRVQPDIDAEQAHESRPFLRLLRVFRPPGACTTPASESLARHRRNTGMDLSMTARSCITSRQ